MATKMEELELQRRGEGCLGKAAMDEPLFILRGQDKLAPALVRAWAALAYEHGCTKQRCEESLQLAASMENWTTRKFPD